MDRALRLAEMPTETDGNVTRRALASPAIAGSGNLRVLHITRNPGGPGKFHTHPGEEVIFTLRGKATLLLGQRHVALEPDTAFVVQPGLQHTVEVLGEEPWVAVCSFCDECPLMAAQRSKAPH